VVSDFELLQKRKILLGTTVASLKLIIYWADG